MPEQDVVHITPEEIINFILEEMEAGMCPSYYSNLVPSVFEVYLYIDDLERLRPLEQRIKDEAAAALTEKMAGFNKVSKPKLKLSLGAKKQPRPKRYETLGEWSVELHENTDDDARENPLVIHSRFPFSTPANDDRAGMLTERITKRKPDGQIVATTTATQRSGTVDRERAAGLIYADLTYEDDTGAHSYAMTTNLIKIGRGAPDRWVDLKLQAKKDVSREVIVAINGTASSVSAR